MNTQSAEVREQRGISFATTLRSPVTQTFCTTLLIIGCGLCAGILLARGLGPQGRGEIAAALLWPGLLVSVAGLGMTQALVVFTASQESLISRFLSTAMSLGLAFSALAMIAGELLLPFFLHSQSTNVVRSGRLFLLVIPAGMESGLIVAVLQGKSQFRKMNSLRLVTPAGYVVGVASLMLFHRLNVVNVVYVQLAFSYLTLLLALWIAQDENIRFSPAEWDRHSARRLLGFGGKAYVGGLTGTFNQRLDQALLAGLFPAAELGLYAVAVSASSAIDTVGFAFRTVVGPRIAQRAAASDKFAQLRASLLRFAPASLGATALLALTLPILIPLFYGNAFHGSILPAEILLMAQLLYTSKTLLTSSAEAFGDSWLGSKAELLGLPIMAALLFLLLPKFGILGAALASLGGCAIQLTVMLAGFAQKHRARERDSSNQLEAEVARS